MMGLFEIRRREARTEIGKRQFEYEQALVWQDAYGGMYRSQLDGKEFCRTGYTVCCVLRGQDADKSD